MNQIERIKIMKAHLGKQSEIDIHDVKSIEFDEITEFSGLGSKFFRTIKIISTDGQEYEINLYSKDGWAIYVNEIDK